VAGGGTLVIASESLEHPGIRWTVWRGDTLAGELTDPAHRPTGGAPPGRPVLERVTDRRLPSGVLYPPDHVVGRRLPVLVEAAGLAQGVRAVRRDWQARQRWADAGFAVVVIDHRGTPGVAPSFEKVVHRRLADLALSDLADALTALVGKHPDLDLARVAIRGHGVGGWLAALAVLRRPELFRCGVAEEPVLDWAEHDPAFAERYLGLPEDAAEVYQRHSLRGGLPEPLLITSRGQLTESELLGWLTSRLASPPDTGAGN
jgi:dipeptidyl-peptidase-4